MTEIKDGVLIAESTVSSGTGDIVLGGALSGFNAISSIVSDGQACVVYVEDGNESDWFFALCTYTSSGNSLSRDQILWSSNGGSNVSLSANTHTVTIEPLPGYVTGPVNYLDQLLSRPELKDYSETLQTPGISSGTLELDLETGNTFSVTLTEDVTTLTISNPPASGKTGSFSLKLAQDATGGRAFAFPASIKFSGGSAPTLSSGADEYDRLVFITEDGGTTWDCMLAGAAFS